MLRDAREGRAGRLAAVLAVVALTGAPRVLALQAPVERHACACRSHPKGDRACSCALCRSAARPGPDSPDRAPGCHRAASHRASPGGGTAHAREAPCLDETCGGAGGKATPAGGVEPFCLPAPARLVPARAPETRPVAGASPRDRALEPETPPPRSA